MEASSCLIMGGGSSSASSSYLIKLVSCCKHNRHMGSSFSIPPPRRNHHYNNTKDVVVVGLIKLSIIASSSSSSVSASTPRTTTTTTTTTSICLPPVSCSSSHSHTHHQADLDNHKLLIQESLNGHTSTIEAEAEAETVRVRFQLHKECSFGHNFLITGDDRVLGLWDPNNALPLTWSQGHLWSADLDTPIGKCIKFKFIMQQSDGVIVWQPGPDRVLECLKTDKMIMMTLCEDWEDPDLRKIIETEPASNQQLQMVEASGDTLQIIEPLVSVVINNNGTEEPKVYATNMKQVLVSDQGVPVLVPGLNQLYQQDSVNVASNDEPESLNGSAKDLISSELDLKGDASTSNLSPRAEISSEREIQDSSDQNEHQQETEEQVTQPREHSIHDGVKWSHNAVQKLLSIFGIQ